MFFKLKFVFVIVFFFVFLRPHEIQANEETTGWFSYSNSNSRLFVDGIRVYDTSNKEKIELPNNLSTVQEIEAYLYLAEYFIRKKNKQGLANILYKIRQKNDDYKLADALITTLWKKSSGEEQPAQLTLSSYIRSEKNPYYKNLANYLYTTLFSSGEDEKKSPALLGCSQDLVYYSFCRLFRLQYYIDRAQGNGEVLEMQYSNILRAISPFYEEKILHSIPFLEELDEDLPPRLAFLGLANEALNFQRILLEAERAIYGYYTENSLERISYFQILSGNWDEAIGSLRELANITKNLKKKSYRNGILIKLGMACYMARRYEESLKYYLEIQFQDWSSLILHPLTGEPLSIPEAKDLISLSVMKTKGKEQAVSALQQIQAGDKVYQEEIWPKLRIAQLVMDSNPELSAKIIDEVSYLSQSRGWKKMEYISTILLGYNRVHEGLHRKAIIEFTKAKGILGKGEVEYANEWLRNSGLFYAHATSGVKAPVTSFLLASLNDLRNEYPDDEYLNILYYKDFGFTLKKFTSVVVDYYSETDDSRLLLETLLQIQQPEFYNDPIYNYGLFQILSVHDKIKKFPGFQTYRESNFVDSSYSQARENFVKYWKNKSNLFDPNFEKNLRNPVVVLLPWQNFLYLFLLDPSQPSNKRWSHYALTTNNPKSYLVKEKIQNFIDSINSPSLIQIFLNKEGIILYEELRPIYKNYSFNLFSRFHTITDYGKDKTLIPIVWKKNPPNSDITTANLFNWEGTNPLSMNNKLFIWDFKNISPRGLYRMEWKNGEESQTLTIKRILRRLDKKSIPEGIFTTSDSLGIGLSWERERFLDWTRFWTLAGTEVIYYRKNISWSDITSIYSNMPIGIPWNQDSEIFVVARDLR